MTAIIIIMLMLTQFINHTPSGANSIIECTIHGNKMFDFIFVNALFARMGLARDLLTFYSLIG